MSFDKKTLRDIDVKERRVLIRVDFNVPLMDGDVADDTRIVASIPTLNYLIDKKAFLILCSHLGRPKGKPVPELSLEPVARRLGELMNTRVGFAKDSIGPEVKDMVEGLSIGEILLLENTRFHPGETKNDPDFAASLAAPAELFVNDAFGTAHRAHASSEGVAHYLLAVAGFLMEKELTVLGGVLENPDHPFVAILGGAKASDKIGVVTNLLQRADKLIIGGGMANTFLSAKGYAMAESLVESEAIESAAEILRAYDSQIILPTDVVIADDFTPDASHQIVSVDSIPSGWRVMDIGPETGRKFVELVKDAKLIVWNGPMGVFEFDIFAEGTKNLANAVAESAGYSVVGGGDSAAAIRKSGLTDQIDHISTGGGASLEFLAGKTLPGVAALENR
ncbi:MAG: phosphoglycerate kinase [Anaerolineales bacterium]|nr:phosphoglycerate kinase [Anaerolineales bacterium]